MITRLPYSNKKSTKNTNRQIIHIDHESRHFRVAFDCMGRDIVVSCQLKRMNGTEINYITIREYIPPCKMNPTKASLIFPYRESVKRAITGLKYCYPYN